MIPPFPPRWYSSFRLYCLLLFRLHALLRRVQSGVSMSILEGVHSRWSRAGRVSFESTCLVVHVSIADGFAYSHWSLRYCFTLWHFACDVVFLMCCTDATPQATTSFLRFSRCSLHFEGRLHAGSWIRLALSVLPLCRDAILPPFFSPSNVSGPLRRAVAIVIALFFFP